MPPAADMTSALFVSILTTGFAVAFLHGALPTHWLPFVLVGRRQGWATGKTLAITAVAGFGHACMTMALGVILVASGLAAGKFFGKAFPLVAGGLLISLGLFYLVRQALGGHAHSHGDAEAKAAGLSDRGAIAGLMVVLTLSPCEAFLPIYISGVKYGWAGFGLLSVVLVGAAVASMVGLTALSLAGVKFLRLQSAARYEGAVMGAALCLLGLLVIVLER